MLDIPPGAHSQLDLGVVEATFAEPLGRIETPARIASLLASDSVAPMQSDDSIRKAVRDLLRVGGFKPTGRSKPASEYLLKAVGQGTLGAINVAVDAANVVSLHSGIPLSVVDADRVSGPLRVAIADEGVEYVFNRAGQTIDVGGLLCLFDEQGPCANAVKDSQRTKTDESTTRVVVVIWGATELPGRTSLAKNWLEELLRDASAETLIR